MKFEIVLIDDDDLILYMHKVLLKQHVAEDILKPFNDAAAAIDYLNEKATATDTDYIILLDINMPHINGWDFIDAMQNTGVYARMHIIMVTSSIDTADKTKASSYSQVIGYSEKPIMQGFYETLKANPAIAHLLN